MPYREDHDTQPLSHGTERNHREYVHADWAAPGGGTEHPKLDGGKEVTRRTGANAPRGLNRSDQRYALPLQDIRNRRAERAAAEFADTLVLTGPAGTYEIRTATGNRYDVASDLKSDDCPDTMRLRESYPGADVACKHVLIVRMAVDQVGAANIPWSTRKLASEVNLSPITIAHKCRSGEIPATLIKLEWAIDPADALTWMAEYRSKMIGAETPDIDFVDQAEAARPNDEDEFIRSRSSEMPLPMDHTLG